MMWGKVGGGRRKRLGEKRIEGDSASSGWVCLKEFWRRSNDIPIHSTFTVLKTKGGG